MQSKSDRQDNRTVKPGRQARLNKDHEPSAKNGHSTSGVLRFRFGLLV